MVFQKGINFFLHPGGGWRVLRADDNQPAGIFQRLPDLLPQVGTAAQFSLVQKDPAKGLPLLGDAFGCPVILQCPLEGQGGGTVHRAVLVADKGIIPHGTQIGAIGLQGIHQIGHIRQHFLSGSIAIPRFLGKRFFQNPLHGIHKMLRTANPPQLIGP